MLAPGAATVGALFGLNYHIWGNNAVMLDDWWNGRSIDPGATPWSAEYWQGAAASAGIGAGIGVAWAGGSAGLPSWAMTTGVVGLSGCGVYTEGGAALDQFRQGNPFQGALHTVNAGLSAYGGYAGTRAVQRAAALERRGGMGVNKLAPNSAAAKIANRSMTKAEWQAYYRQVRSTGGTFEVPPSKLASGSFLEFSRRAMARQFLVESGWHGRRIDTALSGIDFSKPVSVVTIPKGAAVEQWVKAGKVGKWFSPLGQAPELSGISRGMRTPLGFNAVGDVRALRSTALPITDTWTLGKKYPIVTPGGGTQYLVPNHQGLVPYWGY
jgi:hypothetical protein